jgi:hypothetical protein
MSSFEINKILGRKYRTDVWIPAGGPHWLNADGSLGYDYTVDDLLAFIDSRVAWWGVACGTGPQPREMSVRILPLDDSSLCVFKSPTLLAALEKVVLALDNNPVGE